MKLSDVIFKILKCFWGKHKVEIIGNGWYCTDCGRATTYGKTYRKDCESSWSRREITNELQKVKGKILLIWHERFVKDV